MLNKKQQIAIDTILDHKNIFLTGAAGTGKSFIVKYLQQHYNDQFKIVLTSSTGISAINIGGQTLHSWAGIGLGKYHATTHAEKIINSKFAYKRWLNVDILVIDEISMISPILFDKLELIARVVRDSNEPFGGIQLIITGDFFQLPVVKEDNYCFEAKSWNKCINKTIYLKKNVRQEGKKFSKLLNKIRKGKISSKTMALLQSRCIKPSINIKIKPSILYSRNDKVDTLNLTEYNKILKDNKEYKYTAKFQFQSKNGLITSNTKKTTTKFLTKKDNKLNLCIGCQVMLTINLDIENGLVNGSRGIITDFTKNKPIVEFVNGITRVIEAYKRDYDFDTYKVNKKYIPLQLAWAITIHKSQGASLDFVITNLSKNEIFSNGQAYVALSRVRTLDGLFIEKIDKEAIKCDKKVIEYYNNL